MNPDGKVDIIYHCSQFLNAVFYYSIANLPLCCSKIAGFISNRLDGSSITIYIFKVQSNCHKQSQYVISLYLQKVGLLSEDKYAKQSSASRSGTSYCERRTMGGTGSVTCCFQRMNIVKVSNNYCRKVKL